MKSSDSFSEFVLDQLQDLRGVTCVRMFGGHGLYCGEKFFGILSAGKLYFKTDDASRGEYQRRGMEPFRPSEKQTLKNYFEVPVEILEDRDALVDWARAALVAQAKSAPAKTRRKKQ